MSEDLISRQAAIELLRNMQTYIFFEGSDLLLVDQSVVMTELMLLPAAQPERKKGQWIEDAKTYYEQLNERASCILQSR